MLRITDAFDGGNIICRTITDPSNIELEIRKDNQSDFYQWFYFRLSGARHQDCALKILNAGGAAYPKGFEDYRAVASYDRQNWFRVATTYDDGVLTIHHRPDRDAVYYAYFAPYSMERHADLIARVAGDPRVRLEVLGQTLDGQDLDLLTIGEAAAGRKRVWVIARQHPGETMAEWLAEGLLERLLDPNDPVAGRLLEKAVFRVIPNINPDGSRRGHLRTNAAGVNLNRAWQEPSLEKSPEVYLTRQAMHAHGVDFCLDVHGDEALPYNFLASIAGIPSLSEKQTQLSAAYGAALLRANPDFQTDHGYPVPQPGKADLSMCSNFVAETFGSLALTLEQPFKDAANRPDPLHGWSPARAKILGRACLDALLVVVDDL